MLAHATGAKAVYLAGRSMLSQFKKYSYLMLFLNHKFGLKVVHVYSVTVFRMAY
jgi:hypothetical protein